jgi:hypothetical protein
MAVKLHSEQRAVYGRGTCIHCQREFPKAPPYMFRPMTMHALLNDEWECSFCQFEQREREYAADDS